MKKIKASVFIAILAFSLMGCQSADEVVDEKKQQVIDSTSSEVSESKIEEENIFADFQNIEFNFSSGAGAWQTVLTIHEDGSFTGKYLDADMGSRQYYVSNFDGQFTEPVKVNDYTYSLQIAELNYAEEVGKKEQKDEMLYTYEEAYGIAGAEEIFIYLPGTPLDKLPESYKNWVNYAISLAGDSVTELPFYGLYNETEECGFYSYDIVEHLYEFIDGQKEWATSVENSLIYDDLNQSELNELSYQLYEIWDTTLNEEWNVLKQILDEDSMKILLNEQREWIAYKEQEIQNVAAEAGGGSIVALLANQRAASLTESRVYELLDYFTYGEIAAEKEYYSGRYVDKQGTEEIYSELYLSYMGEEEYETAITIYRLASLTGTATFNNEKLLFEDNELQVKGEIVIEDTTAVFTILESEFGPIQKGDSFAFEKSY